MEQHSYRLYAADGTLREYGRATPADAARRALQRNWQLVMRANGHKPNPPVFYKPQHARKMTTREELYG